MKQRRWMPSAPLSIALLGSGLFLVSLVYHVEEAWSLGEPVVPFVAFLFDGVPALGLVYAGRHLSRTDLSPGNRTPAATWCWAGALLFGGVTGLSILVRAAEGRIVSEPVFELLLGTSAGAVAGFVAGLQTARARESTDRAEQATNAVGFVNSMLRHDLRNDLAVIDGHAELLGMTDDPDIETRVATIRRKTDEALERIETTGAAAEALLGERPLEEVDLVTIVEEVAARTEQDHVVSVTTDLPASAHVVAGEALRSVVDNLLENAAEHNSAADPCVSVRVERRGDVVHFSVTDNGPGIPEEETDPLGDDEEVPRGGLAIATALVESYSGELWIEDAGSTGTTVVVALPRGAG